MVILGVFLRWWDKATFYGSHGSVFNTVGILATILATAATFLEVVRSSSKYEALKQAYEMGDSARRSSNINRLSHEITTALRLLETNSKVGVATISTVTALVHETFKPTEIVGPNGEALSGILHRLMSSSLPGQEDIPVMIGDLMTLHNFIKERGEQLNERVGLAAAGVQS